jgi:hypothetical protein
MVWAMPGKWQCAIAIVGGIAWESWHTNFTASDVPAYVTADHSRRRRLNPTPLPISLAEPGSFISLPARTRGPPLLCIHFVLRNTTSYKLHNIVLYSQNGSHQGRLLAPVPNTAICPLLLLRRHHSRYVLTCRNTITHLANIPSGIYSYFLAVQADRNQGIPKWQKAVEGISGVAVLYTIAAVVLTCCLGGITFFAFTAILLDILFVGGFIAIAVLTRQGAYSCSGIVNTPLGIGNADANSEGFGNRGLGFDQGENLTYSVSPRNACRMNKAVFAVSIIAAFLFLITALFQVFLVRKHKKEKRFGPGPSNNYTEGAPKRNFWNRKSKKTDRDAEKAVVAPAAVGTLSTGHATDLRPSHDTAYTGSTVAAPGDKYDKVDGANGYAAQPHQGHAAHGSHGAYYGAPQGTANPYSMDTAPHAATTNQATYGANQGEHTLLRDNNPVYRGVA